MNWRGNGSRNIDICLIDTPSYMPVYLYQQRIRRAGGDHFVELLKLLAAVQPEEVIQVQIPVQCCTLQCSMFLVTIRETPPSGSMLTRDLNPKKKSKYILMVQKLHFLGNSVNFHIVFFASGRASFCTL